MIKRYSYRVIVWIWLQYMGNLFSFIDKNVRNIFILL